MPKGVAERTLVEEELEQQGYAIRIDKWPPRTTFYKPDGAALPGLPADPLSMKRYLARGFTLSPPAAPRQQSAMAVGRAEALECPHCGLVAKAPIGLISHMRRKHPPTQVEGEEGGNHVLPSNA